MKTALMADLRALFGEQVQEQVPLAPYTSARIGGPADVLLTVRSADELAQAAQAFLEHDLVFSILGGGANVLVSDKGVRGIVILNRAKAAEFRRGAELVLWTESGAVFSNLAHRAAAKGPILINPIEPPVQINSARKSRCQFGIDDRVDENRSLGCGRAKLVF